MRTEKKAIFDDLVPIAKVSEQIAIAEKTLRNWRARGVYPHIFVKLGGKVFVDMSELAQIVRVQKKQTIKRYKQLGLLD